MNIGADMIVTPCPVRQMNVEVYQVQISKKCGAKFNIPVTYYSQLMTVAYGGTAKGEAEVGNGPVDRCPAARALKRSGIAQRRKPVSMATLFAPPSSRKSLPGRRRNKVAPPPRRRAV
ncbi:MAG: hypothetical protein ACYDBW_09885 [Sulfuricaulis sp.]